MRRYMTFARIFLILSIINFARAAPVVVRGVHEVHVNVVDVAEDGAATSQKPWDSGRRDWLANAADETSSPTTPRSPDLDHSGLHGPRSSTRLNNAPPSSALSTGPHPRSKDGSPPPSSGPASPLADYSWPSQVQANDPRPPSPDYSTNQLQPHPPSPDYSSGSQFQSDSSRPSTPDSSWASQLQADNPRPSSPYFLSPSRLPAGNSLPRPNSPSESTGSNQPEYPRPTELETKDFLSQLLHPVSSHPTEPETKDFLGLFLKGIIKRRISGSGTLNSAQESQGTIDTRSYVFASSPSPANIQTTPGPWKMLIAPAISANSGVIRRGAGTPFHSMPDYPQNRKRFGVA